MFSITGGKGFKMVFANGWTVSVQFGVGNYCEHHTKIESYRAAGETAVAGGEWESQEAEIAAYDAAGNWHRFPNDDVKGWCKPEEVAAFIQKIAMGNGKPAKVTTT